MEQEWTPKWFETTFQDHDWIQQVCSAHNAALTAEQGAKHHMEACRALLNVPDDEVLYQAIKELQERFDLLLDALEWIVENGEPGTSIHTKAVEALAKAEAPPKHVLD